MRSEDFRTKADAIHYAARIFPLEPKYRQAAGMLPMIR
jgi:hypothetical protein